MKTLLMTISAALLLSACATNAPTTANHNQSQVTNMTCEDKGKVAAIYSANGQVATLNVSLPKIGLNHQKITLNQAVSGSGARYVNNADPKVSYEWHTKSDFGLMSVRTANGQEYSVNCQR